MYLVVHSQSGHANERASVASPTCTCTYGYSQEPKAKSLCFILKDTPSKLSKLYCDASYIPPRASVFTEL